MKNITNFFDENPVFSTVIVTVAFFAVIGIIFIGRSFTPQNGEFLTPQNWQLMNSRKAYEQELNQLRSHILELSQLLHGGKPDPIKVQMTTDSTLEKVGESGHAALQIERDGVRSAVIAVRDWSQGELSFEDAQALLNDVIRLLESATIQ